MSEWLTPLLSPFSSWGTWVRDVLPEVAQIFFRIGRTKEILTSFLPSLRLPLFSFSNQVSHWLQSRVGSMWGAAAHQLSTMSPSGWKEAQNQNCTGQNASSTETPRQVTLSFKKVYKLLLHRKYSILKLLFQVESQQNSYFYIVMYSW